MLNVSGRSLRSAKKVHAHGSPELIEAVDAGRLHHRRERAQITVTGALREAR